MARLLWRTNATPWQTVPHEAFLRPVAATPARKAASSAAVACRMVRNFSMVKLRPFRPWRGARNRTGPRDPARISTATISSRGAMSRSSPAATVTSMARLQAR